MDINNSIQSARKLYKEGNFMQASYVCSGILELQPANIDALMLLGEICSQLKQYDGALQHFREALEINANNVEILCRLGETLRKKGDLNEAIEHFQKAIAINPDYANAYHGLGVAFRDKGQRDESMMYFQKAFLVNKAILVTGSHRSGSSWVGKMIATSPSIFYYHEPLNLTKFRDPCICGTQINYLFQYITDANESAFYNHFKHIIELPYYVTLREGLNFEKGNIRPLIKDPFALFSAEWLTSRFNMDVIVLIRHPAAFVGSLKRLNWDFSFLHFLEQPLLMRDYLYPFESAMKEDINKKHDLIERAALLWKIIHHVILKYQERHKDWIFLRHEDISRRPLDHFQFLFNKLKLTFSEDMKKQIEEYSSPANPPEASPHYAFNKINSEANIWNWKKRLSSGEIKTIRTTVEDVSCKFYSDDDW